MRTIPADALAHITQSVTTLCTCWKIVLTNGDELGFTDASLDLEIGGLTYSATSGLGNSSSLQQHSDLSVSNADVICVLDSESISHHDLLSGLYDGARIYTFLTDYLNPVWTIKLLYGVLGEVTVQQQQARVELRSLTQQLKTRYGYSCEQYCPYDLYDKRCGVDPDDYRVSGSVTAVESEHKFTCNIPAADNYYKYGKILWLTGNNQGLYSKVRKYTGGELTLWEDVPYRIQVNDTLEALPGCDKSYSTCKTKFSNDAFGGFNFVPGSDFMLSYPDAPED